VAWLSPAHKSNPFQMINEVSFHDSVAGAGTDEENADSSQADVQLAAAGGSPDVEPEADQQGKVTARARAPRAQPVAPPPRAPNFFQRLFGAKRPPPTPPPPPVRRRP
jgi:hypothetical protein